MVVDGTASEDSREGGSSHCKLRVSRPTLPRARPRQERHRPPEARPALPATTRGVTAGASWAKLGGAPGTESSTRPWVDSVAYASVHRRSVQTHQDTHRGSARARPVEAAVQTPLAFGGREPGCSPRSARIIRPGDAQWPSRTATREGADMRRPRGRSVVSYPKRPFPFSPPRQVHPRRLSGRVRRWRHRPEGEGPAMERGSWLRRGGGRTSSARCRTLEHQAACPCDMGGAPADESATGLVR